ncbi:DHA2 family efflux MFS transporter permease subunit [Kurthia sibirica]|uniref:MFS transporter n=1 Tax=Kurthia sibirica TaxID=202750 RepID=A0A2U3ANI6_9BACL|nr:MFS transporter [Kurthia sibirica]
MAFVLMLGAFIGLFSETALNMALTNIMVDFSINEAQAQWLTTGYLLTLGILVPVSSLIIKWYTTKQLVVVALVLSIIGTILGALAPSFSLLITARIIQALGTGILLPLMMNVILVIFPIQKRGMVMGLMGLVITTAPAIGPTIAGLIVDLLDWTYIFWLSLVFYSVLLVFGTRQIDNVSTITKPKISVISILLSTIGFGGLIYSLSTIAEKSLNSPQVLIPLLIGIISLISFIVLQLNLKTPMINLRVFKFSMFSLGTAQLFLGMVLILANAILLPLYLKGALFYSAAIAGLILLPGSALNAILSPVIGRAFDKIGAKKLVPAGFILIVIGSLLFVTTLSADVAIWKIIIANMFYFAGVSMIIMPAQTNGLNQLPRTMYTDGAAVMNTLQQIAGAAGTAIAITLMIQGQKYFMIDNPSAVAQEILAAGTKYAFYFITAVAVVGFISALFIKREKQ